MADASPEVYRLLRFLFRRWLNNDIFTFLIARSDLVMLTRFPDTLDGIMNQSTICLYLNRKGLSAKAIRDELVQVLRFDAIAYSTVISYLRASHWMAQNE
jgi:hypothetical protein